MKGQVAGYVNEKVKESGVGWIHMTPLKSLDKENDDLGSLNSHPS